MADVEAMFRQVSVVPEDRKALRFLWWPNGELGAQAEELMMMMIVRLFGGVSSPSCANFAFKKAVEDNPSSFRPSPRVSSLKRTAFPDKDGDTCNT